MPIKPEDLKRYPPDWKAISLAARARAGDRCEWPECGALNGAVGYWEEGSRFVQLGESVDQAGELIDAAILDGHKVIRIVLTVAHLDQQPEHCEPENLRAWCQRHHLRYDRAQHTTSAYMTRRARARTQELFE